MNTYNSHSPSTLVQIEECGRQSTSECACVDGTTTTNGAAIPELIDGVDGIGGVPELLAVVGQTLCE